MNHSASATQVPRLSHGICCAQRDPHNNGHYRLAVARERTQPSVAQVRQEKYVKPQETVCDMFPVISSTLSRTQESMLVCQGYYHQMVVEAESSSGEDQCAANMLLQSLRLAL